MAALDALCGMRCAGQQPDGRKGEGQGGGQEEAAVVGAALVPPQMVGLLGRDTINTLANIAEKGVGLLDKLKDDEREVGARAWAVATDQGSSG